MIKTLIGNDPIQKQLEMNKIIDEESRQYGDIEIIKFNASDKDFKFELPMLALRTQSMFDTRKAIVLEISDKSLAKGNENLLIELLGYASHDVLLIVLLDKKPLAKSPLKKVLESKTQIIKIEAMSSMQRATYIATKVKEKGINISANLVELLDQRIGDDLVRLENELNKLSVLERKIQTNDIYNLVSQDMDDNIFALSDAVLKKNLKNALEVYHSLTQQKIDPLALFGMLASSLRRSYQVNAMLSMNMSAQEIAVQLGMSDKQVYFISKNQRSNHLTTMRLLNQLADKEQQAKSGKIDRFVALELFLIDATTS